MSSLDTYSTGEYPQSRGRWKLWIVLGLLSILYMPTMAWLWGRWTMSVWHHAHGLLILPVVGYMIWKILHQEAGRAADSSPWGFVLLVPALVLLVLDTGIHTQLLSAISFVIALPGLSLLFLGRARTRSILFPLSFSVFMLPIPLAFTEPFHLVLRKIATFASANILPHIGIPVYAEGTTLYTPNAILQVADACSGFSTLYASIFIAVLVAYMCPVVWRRVLVIIAAVPIAIAANIVRVIMLSYFVESRGITVLETPLHTISGLLTFALAIPAIIWLGYTEPADEKKS